MWAKRMSKMPSSCCHGWSSTGSLRSVEIRNTWFSAPLSCQDEFSHAPPIKPPTHLSFYAVSSQGECWCIDGLVCILIFTCIFALIDILSCRWDQPKEMKDNLCEFSGKNFKDQVWFLIAIASKNWWLLSVFSFRTERGGVISPGQDWKTSNGRA